MRTAFFAFLAGIVLSAPVWGVEVKPVNFVMPSPGGILSFDFIVTGAPGQSAYSSQLTIDTVDQISSTSHLVFNIDASEEVSSNPDYWLYGNSAGASAVNNGDGSYTFGDGPDNPPISAINVGDIIARFSFDWDGTQGNYKFTLDQSTINSFVLLENFSSAGFSLPAGQWYSSPVIDAAADSFTVNLIPEPVSIVLFGLAGLVILRKHRR
jgi:hypothetical protein